MTDEETEDLETCDQCGQEFEGEMLYVMGMGESNTFCSWGCIQGYVNEGFAIDESCYSRAGHLAAIERYSATLAAIFAKADEDDA